MLSRRDAFPKAKGCVPQGSGKLSLRPRDAFPKGDALPEAEGCSPQGWDMHAPRDALPEAKGCSPQGALLPHHSSPKLQLPAPQLGGVGVGSRVSPPQRGATWQRGREGKSGCQGQPRSPACCQPCHIDAARLPSAPLGCPPSPRPCFRMHLAPPSPETCQLLTRDIAARGSIRALTPSIVKWPLGTLPWGFKGSIQGATSGSLHHRPPLMGAYPRVQTPRGRGGRAGRFGRRDGDGKQ